MRKGRDKLYISSVYYILSLIPFHLYISFLFTEAGGEKIYGKGTVDRYVISVPPYETCVESHVACDETCCTWTSTIWQKCRREKPHAQAGLAGMVAGMIPGGEGAGRSF